jgi:L,D-peptidoglycan transpeptidase YkuD (ErfK/YbiS/YcfS/YnhG family)
MRITVHPDGWLDFDGRRLRCALGRGGVRADKVEGDGATPTGVYPLRRVLYRADRIDPPETALPVSAIAESDGWCDDPDDAAYNRPVTLPYPGRAESLWRDDHLYDLVIVVGHNDDPVVAGLGSAIFIHVARPGYAPTEGCIALAIEDLRPVVEAAGPGDEIAVLPQV